ncbi:hypothetical protein [Agarivorans sp. DSG3-1]|uniref:hypothetical protein n=1 Tax=Agarivorans sp. DSG3-1 TaxID=3342249 RepID=UPI00398EDBF8
MRMTQLALIPALLAKILSFVGLAWLLNGCAPSVQTVYLTPEVKGQVVVLKNGASAQFFPLAKSNIYHRKYPEKAVESDTNGQFTLAAESQVEASWLMAGHAFNYYPVFIEKGPLRYQLLAEASVKMHHLETLTLSSIIVESELKGEPLLEDSAPSALHRCNFSWLTQLRRSLAVNSVLEQHFTQRSALSTQEQTYVDDQYQQTRLWLAQVKRSCDWRDRHGLPNYDDMKAGNEYFKQIDSALSNKSLSKHDNESNTK